MLDTNVLASGFVRVNPNAIPVQILDAWRADRFHLVVSPPILRELARTFGQPYFQQRLSIEQIAHVLSVLSAEITPISASVSGVAAHPEDDAILATAVSAQAEYLVTGDRKLQGLGRFEGVEILSPRAFLAVLQA